MRKQYDTYECRGPIYEIVLYHDGEKVEVKRVSLLQYDNCIEELEGQGYTRGYTEDDVEKARKKYEYTYENRIEKGRN